MERSPRAAHRRLAMLAVAAALPVQAALTESVLHAPVVEGVAPATIEVTVFRPEGPGPFPLVVLSHGSPRDAAQRREGGRVRLAGAARRFADMGYAVLVPTRRGYGGSGGDWAEGYGSCDDPDYHRAGLETARDLAAALDAVRGERWADDRRVVLAGQSAGGFGSVAAAASGVRGVVAVVNFAGGRGSFAPGRVCREARLVDAMARYGERSRVPELWVYSENDRYFEPALARRMHEAFVRAGGQAEFIEAPPTGDDGHAYFAGRPSDWAPRVESFLRRVGARP